MICIIVITCIFQTILYFKNLLFCPTFIGKTQADLLLHLCRELCIQKIHNRLSLFTISNIFFRKFETFFILLFILLKIFILIIIYRKIINIISTPKTIHIFHFFILLYLKIRHILIKLKILHENSTLLFVQSGLYQFQPLLQFPRSTLHWLGFHHKQH